MRNFVRSNIRTDLPILPLALFAMLCTACVSKGGISGTDGEGSTSQPASSDGIPSGETPNDGPGDAEPVDEGQTDTGGGDGNGTDTPSPSPEPPPGPARLRGAFLQVLNSFDEAFWRSAVQKMHALGMTDVVIQTEAYVQQDGALNSVSRTLITAILDEAEANGMKVFIGLALPEFGNGSPEAAKDADFVEDLISWSKASAERVFSSWGAHPAFGGWYLPVETWTPDTADGLGLLPGYIREVATYCQARKPARVLISPFISNLATDPALTTAVYQDLLEGSGVTTVALQDGVGARTVDPAEFGQRIEPYQAAMAAACTAPCDFWANVESFQGGGAPADYERFSKQVESASKTSTSLISFEFSTCWMEQGPGGAAAKALHDAYAAERLP